MCWWRPSACCAICCPHAQWERDTHTHAQDSTFRSLKFLVSIQFVLWADVGVYCPFQYPCTTISFIVPETDLLCPNTDYVKCSIPKIPGCQTAPRHIWQHASQHAYLAIPTTSNAPYFLTSSVNSNMLVCAEWTWTLQICRMKHAHSFCCCFLSHPSTGGSTSTRSWVLMGSRSCRRWRSSWKRSAASRSRSRWGQAASVELEALSSFSFWNEMFHGTALMRRSLVPVRRCASSPTSPTATRPRSSSWPMRTCSRKSNTTWYDTPSTEAHPGDQVVWWWWCCCTHSRFPFTCCAFPMEADCAVFRTTRTSSTLPFKSLGSLRNDFIFQRKAQFFQ